MVFKVYATEDFRNDVNEVCMYMETNFKSIYASNKIKLRIKHIFLLLENTPMMFSVIEKYDRVKRRYRRAIINNYIMLYTIGDVSEKTGLPAPTLRYYDKEGLLPLVNRGNGGIRKF